jgi:hypothetical protein
LEKFTKIEQDFKKKSTSSLTRSQIWFIPLVDDRQSAYITKIETRGVSNCGLAIYIKKYLKEKRRIMETQIFHHAKLYQSSKNPLKETKSLQDIINSTTNLKLQHKPKYHLSPKILMWK